MPKLIFVTTEGWAFLTHRLPMAEAARECGFDVIVATNTGTHDETIQALGYRTAHIPFKRRNKNPLAEVSVIFKLIGVFLRERPSIVHNIAIKPILDGSFAALICRVPHVVNTYTGLGALFIDKRTNKWLRASVLTTLRLLVRGCASYTIVQNKDDELFVRENGIAHHARSILIPGSGVDTNSFKPSSVPRAPEEPVKVVMVSRLLWDKGLQEVVDAARSLKSMSTPVQFVVVGAPDLENPKSISTDEYDRLRDEGVIDFPGHQSDILKIWETADIAILPSYREGLPKSLLEAASCGVPLIATDVPGCRELVENGKNGLLVPVQNSSALVEAILELTRNADMRHRLGQGARLSVEQNFSSEIIRKMTAELYSRLGSTATS